MKRRGFTLIELIVVLAIISISFGVLTLKFSIIDKIGAKNEIQTFVDDYSYLRDLSLSTGYKNYIDFTSRGYTMSGVSNKTRNLKYIKALNTSKITFAENAYVSTDKTSDDYNLDFVSKKDPNIKWNFTIEPIGGYLSEKNN
ncbi:prepilin-type N-terminal cleavage/methylation domain-containing protein [uncultured Anaerococcus sp.]|uniref:type II secretion system protein n=1 Tax=uncultured Anaerococcus sp. TaxID=293428 RepID=UPI002889C879|nr:prepilin-type N-terminal cleavage/methylation domain-containing protein [uncultured Anaerococcus sp.]